MQSRVLLILIEEEPSPLKKKPMNLDVDLKLNKTKCLYQKIICMEIIRFPSTPTCCVGSISKKVPIPQIKTYMLCHLLIPVD